MRNGLKVCNRHTEKYYVALTPSLGQPWEERSPFGCPVLDEGCGDKTDDKQHQSCQWTRAGGGLPSPPCPGFPPEQGVGSLPLHALVSLQSRGWAPFPSMPWSLSRAGGGLPSPLCTGLPPSPPPQVGTDSAHLGSADGTQTLV